VMTRAGGVLDLECLCNDVLGPVGVPGTCAQASQSLSSQSALVVCEQASLGRCAPVAFVAPDGGGASGGGSGSGSGCTQRCQDLCAGVLDCRPTCGCGMPSLSSPQSRMLTRLASK